MQAPSSPRTSIFDSIRRPSAALTILFVTAVVAGGTAATSLVAPSPVYAACHAVNQNCAGGPTKTAAADVYYFVPDPNPGGTTITPVEPDNATSWTITAVWSPTGPLSCVDTTENATVDVTWTGTSWSVSNFAGTVGINAVSVCTLAYCSTVTDTHSFGYRMYVSLDDPYVTIGNLSRVTFTATTVPNGHEFDLTACTLGNATTPTASSFNGTDSGSFECAYNCSATGTTVNITYN